MEEAQLSSLPRSMLFILESELEDCVCYFSCKTFPYKCLAETLLLKALGSQSRTSTTKSCTWSSLKERKVCKMSIVHLAASRSQQALQLPTSTEELTELKQY
jgi:hypothetical protein